MFKGRKPKVYPIKVTRQTMKLARRVCEMPGLVE